MAQRGEGGVSPWRATQFQCGQNVEQDDGENWNEIQRVLRGYRARLQPLNVSMGIGHAQSQHPDYPGLMSDVYAEEAARGFYTRWANMLAADDWTEADRLGAAAP